MTYNSSMTITEAKNGVLFILDREHYKEIVINGTTFSFLFYNQLEQNEDHKMMLKNLRKSIQKILLRMKKKPPVK